MNRRLSSDIINALTEQNHEQLNVSRQILLDLVEQRVALSEQNLDLINISREILASESRVYKETTEQQNSTNEGLQTLNRRFSQMEQRQEDRGSCIMDELFKQNHKLSNASQVLAILEHESYDCKERTAQLSRSDDDILQTLDNMSRIQRSQEELCNTSNGLLLNISRDLAEENVITARRDQMSFETLSGVAAVRREHLNSSEQILRSLGQLQQSQQELSSTSDQLMQSSFLDMNVSSVQIQHMQQELNNSIMSEFTEQKRELNNVSQVLLRIETASQVSREVSKETSEQLNSTYEILHRMEQRQEQLGDELKLRHEHLNTTSQVLQILEQRQEDLGSGIMDELFRQNNKLSNASEVLASLERESYDCKEQTAQLNRGDDEILQTLDNMSQVQRRQGELCNSSNGLLLNISRDLAEAVLHVVTEKNIIENVSLPMLYIPFEFAKSNCKTMQHKLYIRYLRQPRSC